MLNRIIILFAFTAVLLAGCKGKGPEPSPANYYLYAGVHSDGRGGHAYVARIDTRADTVLDSFPAPVQEIMRIRVSSDGRYIHIPASYRTIIMDAASKSVIADIPDGFHGLLSADQRLFLGAKEDSVILFDMPNFGRVAGIEAELFFPKQIPGTSRVIGVDRRPSGESPGYESSKLSIFDLVQRREVDSLIIDPDAEGVGLQVFSFELSPDGKRLYTLSGSVWSGGEIGMIGRFIVGYDLTERRLLFARRVFTALGFCQVSPDGQEVWYTAARETRIPSWPKYVFILDAFTGTPLDSISTLGFYPDTIPGAEHEALQPQDIRFLPSGEKAYVVCGKVFNGHAEPILVIDTRTREVIDLIFDDFTLLIESIDLAPGP